MHHTESEISRTISFLPPGKASKGNVLLVCERKDCLEFILMLSLTVLFVDTSAYYSFKICLIFLFMWMHFQIHTVLADFVDVMVHFWSNRTSEQAKIEKLRFQAATNTCFIRINTQ